METFNGFVFCFLFLGILFFWSVSNLAIRENHRKIGGVLSIICLISLLIYLYPHLNNIAKGIAAGLLGGTILFGWIFVIAIICLLCSIFIK